MRMPRKRFLTAALILCSSTVFSCSSEAGPVTGEWMGIETYYDVVIHNGKIVSIESGTVDATLSVEFGSNGRLDVTLSTGPTFNTGHGLYGPTAAAGAGVTLGLSQSQGWRFAATYESISPDGQIENGDGTAVAGITTVQQSDPFHPHKNYIEIDHVNFTSVPEPASISLAMSGLAAAAIFWSRRLLAARLRGSRQPAEA